MLPSTPLTIIVTPMVSAAPVEVDALLFPARRQALTWKVEQTAMSTANGVALRIYRHGTRRCAAYAVEG